MTDCWTLEAMAARVSVGPLQASARLDRPEAGLSALMLAGQPLPGAKLLGIELTGENEAAPMVADAYCRGGDLVASYADPKVQPTAVQLYWRVNPAPAPALAEIDLEVSVQTPLLDSDPALWTRSRLPKAVFLCIGGSAVADFSEIDPHVGELEIENVNELEPASLPSGWLVRPAGAGMSYFEMVHPADFCVSRLVREDPSGEWLLRHRLFVSRLEKGVILRARVRGVLLEREGDCQQAAAAYRRFIESPPPLTT
jgi:hypothetical protein